MISPDHLLDHAREELPKGPGAPRKSDLHRAVSSAYYAVFHELCKQTADTFVGYRNDSAWLLFYRALDHGKARDRCRQLAADPNLDAGLAVFATAFMDLQVQRHSCDYDPGYRIARTQAVQAIAMAQRAIESMRNADAGDRLLLLSFILLGKRG